MDHELSITAEKETDFGEWYQQIITKGDLIEYYDVSGCYVLLPDSFHVWETIQKSLDEQFKSRGVRNAYFPIFITEKNLMKEKTHLEDFTPEVAWVTRSGSKEMDEPIAVRPTSECAIYSILPKRISSYQDLPLKLNQWANVVRWEFKDATPFIRSREFLWQEGHTCFTNKEDAMEEVLDIIQLYKKTYQDLLCIPTIMGCKTEKEKFAGADTTYTVETFIKESGKAIQAATAHYLGQNFSKMFDITYQDSNGKNQFVHQNSWGFTTRSIGISLMVHSDNKGVIYPPDVAPTQIVIIPILFKKGVDEVLKYVDEVYNYLNGHFRVVVDNSKHNPGWKYNFWERHGVPLRIEIGPRDVKNQKIVVCRRDTGEKETIEFDDDVGTFLLTKFMMDSIKENLYKTAETKMMDSIKYPTTYEEFQQDVLNKNMCLVPFCGKKGCENTIKEETTAKSLCIPSDKLNGSKLGDQCFKCFKCGQDTNLEVLFGKSF